MLCGIIITQIEVIIVNRREQLCIFMKHEDFVYHSLYSIHGWVGDVREVSETHGFKYSEHNEDGGEVTIRSDVCETPIHETT